MVAGCLENPCAMKLLSTATRSVVGSVVADVCRISTRQLAQGMPASAAATASSVRRSAMSIIATIASGASSRSTMLMPVALNSAPNRSLAGMSATRHSPIASTAVRAKSRKRLRLRSSLQSRMGVCMSMVRKKVPVGLLNQPLGAIAAQLPKARRSRRDRTTRHTNAKTDP